MNINIILTKFVEIINSTLIKNIVDLSSTFNFNIPIKTTCKEHCIKFKKCWQQKCFAYFIYKYFKKYKNILKIIPHEDNYDIINIIITILCRYFKRLVKIPIV